MIDPLMDKLRPGWRERAAVQRTWWKPIERLLVLAVTLALYSTFARYAVWGLHVVIHPEDTGRLAQVLAGPPRFVPLVGLFGGFVPFLCLSGIVVNSVVCLIPPLRRVSERGSDQHQELTIRRANRDLFRAGLCSALIAAPLLALAAATPFHHH
jgi:hypothetical protein